MTTEMSAQMYTRKYTPPANLSQPRTYPGSELTGRKSKHRLLDQRIDGDMEL